MIARVLIALVVSTAALLLLGDVLPGFSIEGVPSALGVAVVAGALNVLVWPIVIRLALPLTVMTLVLAVLVWLFRILKAVIGLPGQMRAMRAAKVQDFLNKVRTERGLAPIACSNILKAGENAYFSEEAELFETQAVREHRSFRTGFRIAKGVYVGNSFGRSKSRQEWTKLDTGILTITNERLIYGGSQARTVPLTKIVSVEGNHDAVAVSVEGRAKTMVFKTPNNAILSMILRICCAVDDPGNIPELPMEIEAP